MPFFTSEELDSIRSNPASIASLYAQDRTHFVADLNSNFATQPEDYIKLAFTTVLSYELTPYGSGPTSNTTDLQTLLNNPTMMCTNYCTVAWLLYNMLGPSGTSDVTQLGWNDGVVGNHAQLMIGAAGEQAMLADPTIGLIALTAGYNDLTAGVAIAPEDQQSFFWRQDIGLPQFNETVESALTDGLYRGGHQLYWFEDPQFVDRYGWSINYPTPQREMIYGSNDQGLSSIGLANEKAATAADPILIGSGAADHLRAGPTGSVVFGGAQFFNGSNANSYGMKLNPSNFFTGDELQQVQDDAGYVTTLYDNEKARFLASIGAPFASLPEQEVQLAFAGLLANELKPFDGNAADLYTFSDLIAAPTLNADDYAQLAWRLFEVLVPDSSPNSPTGDPDIVQVGWEGGPVGREAQLIINVSGQRSLLVDPTIAHFALFDGFNDLLAGEAVPISDQQSFLTQAQPALEDTRDVVTTALHEGLYRAGNLLYWFEQPDDMGYFFQSPGSPAYDFNGYHLSGGPISWATPEGDVVRAEYPTSAAIGAVASHDQIVAGPGPDVLAGDGIVNNDGSWTAAASGMDGWFIGDFNGDGLEDIFRYAPGHTGADVYLSTGSAFVESGSWTGFGYGDTGWYVGDFNGDGKADIFRYMPGTSGADVFLSSGTSFDYAASWTGAGSGHDGWYVGDFDGDGKTDVFRYLPGISGADMFLSNGAAFVYAGSWTAAGNGADKWYIGDFNGDGKDDLLRYLPGTSGGQVFLSTGHSFSYDGSWTGFGHGELKWFVEDVNGDGKDDLVGNPYMTAASSVVLLSTGSSFVLTDQWSPQGNGAAGWGIGDFNGDGKADLLDYTSNTSGASVLLGNGGGYHDGDQFVFSPGTLNSDTIVGFKGVGEGGGDRLWFEGFGSQSDLSLMNVTDGNGNTTDQWTLINLANGSSETFRIVGIHQLTPADISGAQLSHATTSLEQSTLLPFV
jgi:hypothetical protein